ncbi:MAG: hypothetical protein PVF50_09765 [Gammaproteobacteria bacterium]|jgi:hypothetical protein
MQKFRGLSPVVVYAAVAFLAMSAPVDADEDRVYPDWSGVWENVTGIHFTNPAGEPNPPPLNDEYAARYQAVRDSAARGEPINDPTANCVWPGVPRIIVSPYPSEYVITSDRVYILYEYMSQIRRIFTDGRGHPDDLEPSYNGHSIGRWEGDTLIVETVGLREDTMYENTGLPHSDQLVINERIRLIGPDMLENEVTAHDPRALTGPWTTKVHYQRQPDWQIMDYVCEENNRNPLGPDGSTLTLGPDGVPLD